MYFQKATDMYVLKPHTTEADIDMEIITFIVRMLATIIMPVGLLKFILDS